MKHAITLRIDTGLLEAARHRAQVENRTLTNFVETLLKRHIESVPPALGATPAAMPATKPTAAGGKQANG